MRNLLQLLFKYHRLFLFMFLEGLAIILVVQYNNYHRSNFLSSANAVAGSIYDVQDNVTGYINLNDKNELLAQQNAELLNTSKLAIKKLTEEYISINDTIYQQEYKFIPASVVNQTIHKSNNYLTLDRGKNDGIEQGMAVVGPIGIVGLVNGVSSGFSSVASVLNSNSVISCKVKSSGSVGNMIWNLKEVGSHEVAQVINLPFTSKIVKGDTIVTTGYASFPGEIPIGVVENIEDHEDGQSLLVDIKLILDMNALDQVYVVKDYFRKEKLELEKESQSE